MQMTGMAQQKAGDTWEATKDTAAGAQQRASEHFPCSDLSPKWGWC
jgi:hypothetical protein